MVKWRIDTPLSKIATRLKDNFGNRRSYSVKSVGDKVWVATPSKVAS